MAQSLFHSLMSTPLTSLEQLSSYLIFVDFLFLTCYHIAATYLLDASSMLALCSVALYYAEISELVV
jgi:hypothetical protein